MMSGIRSKNTKPELLLRSGLHRRGLRFRLHNRKLPGSPDLVFAKFKSVVFVHGCFWHGHDCKYFRLPGTRSDFWNQKIESNVLRDRRSKMLVEEAGWRVMTVWECALRGKSEQSLNELFDQIESWLISSKSGIDIRGA